MGYKRRGVRDGTGPYQYSYERLSRRRGRRGQCYRKGGRTRTVRRPTTRTARTARKR